jgi:hypothetical protein
MASDTLPVLSQAFSTAFCLDLDREVAECFRAVERAEAHVHLTNCWFEDEFCDCRELATVHQLGTDYSYCLRHFQQITKGGK